MGAASWPLRGLRLSLGGLVLRPMTEADVAALAEVLPDDVEQDPSLPSHPGLAPRQARAVALQQEYGRHLGAWTAGSWRLPFLVLHAGQPVGAQELEGPDFPQRRTVETSSWLVPAARGRGLGQAMRAAVLGLAFDHLDAQAAETEAWHDNAASLGVSRALGYQPNGETLHPREGVPGVTADVMVRLRLTRAAWDAARAAGGAAAAPVVVTGFDACWPLFGL